MKTTNLDEPGANLDQLFELAINLKNARTFAGKGNGDDDWDWREGDWTDPDDDDLYDWEPKPVVPEPRTLAEGGEVMPEHLTKVETNILKDKGFWIRHHGEILDARIGGMEAKKEGGREITQDDKLYLFKHYKELEKFGGDPTNYINDEGDSINFKERIENLKTPIPETRSAAKGTYGKFAQQIASGGRVGFVDGSKWNVRSPTTGRLLPEPIEEVKNYLIGQGKNIEGITDDKILRNKASDLRQYLKRKGRDISPYQEKYYKRIYDSISNKKAYRAAYLKRWIPVAGGLAETKLKDEIPGALYNKELAEKYLPEKYKHLGGGTGKTALADVHSRYFRPDNAVRGLANQTEVRRFKRLTELSNPYLEQALAGTKKSGYRLHHMGSIFGKTPVTTGNLAYISKSLNAKLSKFDSQIGKKEAEQVKLLLSKPKDWRKKLFQINKEGSAIIKNLPKEAKGLLGFSVIDPVSLKVDEIGIDITKSISKGVKKDIIALKGADKISRTRIKELAKISWDDILRAGSSKAALKATRFIPGLGIATTVGLGAYGLYDAIKKGHTKPSELLASAAWGSAVEFKDKEEK